LRDHVIHVGEYLALTGARLNGKELVAAGLATHFVTSEVWLCSTLSGFPHFGALLCHIFDEFKYFDQFFPF